jgi:DNA repair exonuclease SbcCD ATPase subunit
LFVNSQDETAFPINFVFGVAQDKLNDRRGAKAKIAALDSALQESKRIHREAAAQFEDAKSRIELEESALKFKLDRYNHTVESWNSSGGALAEVVDQLTQEKQDISDEKAQVERDIPEVEALRSNANSLADESNRKLEEYDKAVRAFNSKFGSEISVVLGECRSNSLGVESIQIYGYKDEDDLAFVLAHELGHALGLGHVKGEGAIMSAVEKGEKRAAKFELTPRDLKELQTAMKRAGG